MIKIKNEDITADRVVVINSDGENLGEYKLEKAQAIAVDEKLDLVQVGDADIPICKLMDFSKHMYSSKKKVKKKGNLKLKEIKIKTSIADGDRKVKVNHIDKFLSKGHPVKISVQGQKRRINNDNSVLVEFMDRVLKSLTTQHQLQNDIVNNGNFCNVVITPKKRKEINKNEN